MRIMINAAVRHDELDAAVDEAVAQAGGDLLAAIRNLARRQHELEHRFQADVSAGFVRRGLKPAR
ncbi:MULTISPECIES: hypothetical protein [Aureimonas]|jgi:hypothetical protein|uniref:Uncharacterized protein n=2 Tax=Aureimonas TaxID=414371 RepID=A0A7W6FW39_9HYPH|nr:MULTISPECIES: hypothetical protein [Aureimonas]KQQ79444.1 hypothetical protein ASF65_12830 [Aureimonas sp. Leaf324]MBB3937818.1 hypothetical protein [Aureimonas phyllosphaerae]MBB3961851.1 hypothetical protein [Aureimonas phyllosphaerae]SFF50940.1 hypothetical protein SAMN05216566_11949 [Aureimonas phyllosphaerae]